MGVEDESSNDQLFDNGQNNQEYQQYVFNYSWDFVVLAGMSDIEITMDMCRTGYPEMKFT